MKPQAFLKPAPDVSSAEYLAERLKNVAMALGEIDEIGGDETRGSLAKGEVINKAKPVNLAEAVNTAEIVSLAEALANAETLYTLETLYSRDVYFEDPFLALQGRKAVMRYFAKLFRNLLSCKLRFHQTLIGDTDIFMSWKIYISHPRLRKGSTIQLDGASYLKTRNGKIFYQRNYFDLGEALYENVPVLGWIVKRFKKLKGK